jgi:hypothetical protein
MSALSCAAQAAAMTRAQVQVQRCVYKTTAGNEYHVTAARTGMHVLFSLLSLCAPAAFPPTSTTHHGQCFR